jgi:hypothetical protein
LKFLILNWDYPAFLSHLYRGNPGLHRQSYAQQRGVRAASLFGVADFYSSNLRRLGHEAWDVHVNNAFSQAAWVRQQGLRTQHSKATMRQLRGALQYGRRLAARTPLRLLKPLLRPVLESLDTWRDGILAAQIRYYQPDVLLNQAMHVVDGQFLRAMKGYVRLLIGQLAAPVPNIRDLGVYDLVISSLPNIVEYFRSLGVPSALHRLAFEPAVLQRLGPRTPEIPVSFVGSLSPEHRERVDLLERLCAAVDLAVWGPGVDGLTRGSQIRSHYRGPAWGIDMYEILQSSKITVNHHIGVAERYANNMRLFEATGVGTLLVTDQKANLEQLFEPGKELLAFRTPEECSEMIGYYLAHDADRGAVARAGQQRTLREHTYYQRMQELVAVAQRYL